MADGTILDKLKQMTGSVATPSADVLTIQPAAGSTAPLPIGAATAARQDTGNASLASMDAKLPSPVSSRVPVDGSGVTQPVSIATAPVLVAGSAIIGKVGIDQTTPGTTNGTQDAASSATGAAVSAKAIFIGGEVSTDVPPLLTDGHLQGLMLDTLKRLVVTLNAVPENVVQNRVILTTTTAETTMLAADANNCLDLTAIMMTNTSTTAVTISVRDSTGGTEVFGFRLAATGGGVALAFPTPFKQAAKNNNWTIQSSGSVTDVRCTFQAIKRKT